jgi:hypothetical protein
MLLKARFFLKDYYGLPKLRITVFDAGGDETSVAEGVFKSYELHETGGFYDCYFPFEARSAPAKLRIEHSGYGGQGLAYFEIQSRHSAFAPSGVSLLSGTARDLEAVLKDDYSFAYLGNPDTLAAIHNSALAGEKTAAEFSLSEKTP